MPIYEHEFGPEHPRTLDVRASLAMWTGAAGDSDQASNQYAALLPAYERTFGPKHPETLAIRQNLAFWTRQAGKRLRRWGRQK